LSSIAGDKSSTIVFPLPIELPKGMADLSSHSADATRRNPW
jgi:hypothetical protein